MFVWAGAVEPSAGATGLTQQGLAVAGRGSKNSYPEVSCPPGFETLSLSVASPTAGVGSETILCQVDLT